MPDDIQLDELTAAVHHALKHHRSKSPFEVGPLADMRVVQAQLRELGLASDAAGLNQAIHAALHHALEQLKQVQPDAAQLLERRFVRGESVTALSYELHIAPNTLHYRQSQAINALVAQLLRMEQACSTAPASAPPPRAENLPWELPPATYTSLFGIEAKRAAVVAALCRPDGPAFVVIDGIGGAGKTTLAHAVAERCRDHFDALLWLTARREAEFDTWNATRRKLDRPALTAELVLDAIAARLGLRAIAQQSLEEKQAWLAPHLDRIHPLIVIDNLETMADGETVVQVVRHLERPTRFLVTSRHRLAADLAIHMDDLSLADSLALLRHEAAKRGLEGMERADDAELEIVYQVVGGNPLALKLVVGQATHLPFRRVLEALKAIPPSPESAQALFYSYLYQQSWSMLSPDARELLVTMTVLPINGGTWDDLLALSGLDVSRLDRAIAELVRFSLLEAGGWPDKIYSIHRLTYSFLMSKVMQWW